MSKREKIIIFVMALVVIFGVYSFFADRQSRIVDNAKTSKNLAEIDKLVEDITKQLKETDSIDVHTLIITKAESEWERDPFFDKKLLRAVESFDSADQIKEVSFTYTGYISMGKRKLAIINGLEYSLGEELESKGYIVWGIYPNKVIIKVKAIQSLITVPFESKVF